MQPQPSNALNIITLGSSREMQQSVQLMRAAGRLIAPDHAAADALVEDFLTGLVENKDDLPLPTGPAAFINLFLDHAEKVYRLARGDVRFTRILDSASGIRVSFDDFAGEVRAFQEALAQGTTPTPGEHRSDTSEN